MGLWGIIGVLVIFAAFFVTMPLPSRRHLALARDRRRIAEGEFVTMMSFAGVSATTARFLWTALKPFYHAPLQPLPADRLESLIVIDRPEIEGIVGRFWFSMRGDDGRPPTSPLAPDPTVAELGRHCDLLAGWTVRGSA